MFPGKPLHQYPGAIMKSLDDPHGPLHSRAKLLLVRNNPCLLGLPCLGSNAVSHVLFLAERQILNSAASTAHQRYVGCIMMARTATSLGDLPEKNPKYKNQHLVTTCVGALPRAYLARRTAAPASNMPRTWRAAELRNTGVFRG